MGELDIGIVIEKDYQNGNTTSSTFTSKKKEAQPHCYNKKAHKEFIDNLFSLKVQAQKTA